MSCYEWEDGTIVIPTDQYRKFKKDFRDAWNRHQSDRHKRALLVYADAKAGRKISHEDRQEFWEMWWNPGSKPRLDTDMPLKPTKKMFKQVTNRTLAFHLDEASVVFDDKTHSVAWHVPENNHAREFARAHPMAKVFFRMLDSVRWNSRSGGVIVGNDEYNTDSFEEGGGANYIIESFGKKREKPVRRWS